MAALPEIRDFLLCETPQAWIDAALENQSVMLIDHANCEKKAAATAMNLLYRYIDRPALLHKLSRLAREELRHFEQVQKLMQKLDVPMARLAPGRYAGALRAQLAASEPQRKRDLLLAGALIEARSCERFEVLAPLLPEPLATFYAGLAASERRHAQLYVQLAHGAAPAEADSGAKWVPADADGGCPDSHPVKATKASRIFHVPGGQFYARTKAERCFCDAEAAEADGYRAAKR